MCSIPWESCFPIILFALSKIKNGVQYITREVVVLSISVPLNKKNLLFHSPDITIGLSYDRLLKIMNYLLGPAIILAATCLALDLTVAYRE